MREVRWILAAGVLIVATACWAGKEKVDVWFRTLPVDTPKIDVSGKWVDPGGGNDYESGQLFGQSLMMVLQDGAKLSGSFRGKDVVGMVSGNKVYIAAMKGGAVYFTLHLTYEPKTQALQGKVCDFFQTEQIDGCPAIVFFR